MGILTDQHYDDLLLAKVKGLLTTAIENQAVEQPDQDSLTPDRHPHARLRQFILALDPTNSTSLGLAQMLLKSTANPNWAANALSYDELASRPIHAPTRSGVTVSTTTSSRTRRPRARADTEVNHPYVYRPRWSNGPPDEPRSVAGPSGTLSGTAAAAAAGGREQAPSIMSILSSDDSDQDQASVPVDFSSFHSRLAEFRRRSREVQRQTHVRANMEASRSRTEDAGPSLALGSWDSYVEDEAVRSRGRARARATLTANADAGTSTAGQTSAGDAGPSRSAGQSAIQRTLSPEWWLNLASPHYPRPALSGQTPSSANPPDFAVHFPSLTSFPRPPPSDQAIASRPSDPNPRPVSLPSIFAPSETINAGRTSRRRRRASGTDLGEADRLLSPSAATSGAGAAAGTVAEDGAGMRFVFSPFSDDEDGPGRNGPSPSALPLRLGPGTSTNRQPVLPPLRHERRRIITPTMAMPASTLAATEFNEASQAGPIPPWHEIGFAPANPVGMTTLDRPRPGSVLVPEVRPTRPNRQPTNAAQAATHIPIVVRGTASTSSTTSNSNSTSAAASTSATSPASASANASDADNPETDNFASFTARRRRIVREGQEEQDARERMEREVEEAARGMVQGGERERRRVPQVAARSGPWGAGVSEGEDVDLASYVVGDLAEVLGSSSSTAALGDGDARAAHL